MSILTLKEAESELTLEVVKAEVVEGNYGKQAKFTDKNGDVLFVPESSVTRQLDRCGVAEIEDMTGKTIHFSRSKANAKGTIFWNLDRAKASDVVHGHAEPADDYNNVGTLPGDAPKTNGRPVVADALPQATNALEYSKWVEMQRKYNECVAAAQSAWGRDCGDEALVAAAATLFIGRNQAHV